MTLVTDGAAAVHSLRCNPYGHSTGPGGDTGPKHLMGGLYGPEYEGPKKWECRELADGYYLAECACGHKGSEPRPLCASHVRETQRRQMGVCVRCITIEPMLSYMEDDKRAKARVAALMAAGADETTIRIAVTRVEDIALMQADLVTRGLQDPAHYAHRCPVKWTEISGWVR